MSATLQDHKHVTHDGEKWFLFSVDYPYDGRSFSFEFHARTYEEAIEMLRSIRCRAVDCHQIYAQLPALPEFGWFVRLYCWIRNLLLP